MSLLATAGFAFPFQLITIDPDMFGPWSLHAAAFIAALAGSYATLRISARGRMLEPTIGALAYFVVAAALAINGRDRIAVLRLDRVVDLVPVLFFGGVALSSLAGAWLGRRAGTVVSGRGATFALALAIGLGSLTLVVRGIELLTVHPAPGVLLPLMVVAMAFGCFVTQLAIPRHHPISIGLAAAASGVLLTLPSFYNRGDGSLTLLLVVVCGYSFGDPAARAAWFLAERRRAALLARAAGTAPPSST